MQNKKKSWWPAFTQCPRTGCALLMLILLVACEEDGRLLGPVKDKDKPVVSTAEQPAGVGMELNENKLKPKMKKLYRKLIALTTEKKYEEVFDLFYPEYQVEFAQVIEKKKGQMQEAIRARDSEDGTRTEKEKVRARAWIRSNLNNIGFLSDSDIPTYLKLTPQEYFGRQYRRMIEKGGRRTVTHKGIKDAAKGMVERNESDGAVLLDEEGQILIEQPVDEGLGFLAIYFDVIDSEEENDLFGGAMPTGADVHQLLLLLKWVNDEETGEPDWQITFFGPLDFRYAPKKGEPKPAA